VVARGVTAKATMQTINIPRTRSSLTGEKDARFAVAGPALQGRPEHGGGRAPRLGEHNEQNLKIARYASCAYKRATVTGDQ
jgi:hypothetical protein